MTRLPSDALDECEAVADHGAVKYHEPPGAERWAERTIFEHTQAARRHLERWRRGERHDAETGRHPLAHAIDRLLFVLAMELRE